MLAAAPRPRQIIDTHTHFYDPTRPQGVPWPPKNDPLLYRPVLPAEFVKMTRPLGVTGTIEVEAGTPLVEDNQWVLDLARTNHVIVGHIGRLDAGTPDFPRHLERFAKNPLFRGIRLGGAYIAPRLGNAAFTGDLKRMAAAKLTLDTVGGAPMLRDLLRLTDTVPDLNVVIDHLPFDPPAERSVLAQLGKRPNIYAKVSNVLRRPGGVLRASLDYYRPALDELWETFGPDRVMYGSNWPVSDRVAPYPEVLRVVMEYFGTKGEDALNKYFWRNSSAAYRWMRRS